MQLIYINEKYAVEFKGTTNLHIPCEIIQDNYMIFVDTTEESSTSICSQDIDKS